MLVNVPHERDLSLAWLPARRQIIIDVAGRFQYDRTNGVILTARSCPIKTTSIDRAILCLSLSLPLCPFDQQCPQQKEKDKKALRTHVRSDRFMANNSNVTILELTRLAIQPIRLSRL